VEIIECRVSVQYNYIHTHIHTHTRAHRALVDGWMGGYWGREQRDEGTARSDRVRRCIETFIPSYT
jgi:hypothetical protein